MGLQVTREDGSAGDIKLYLLRWALKNSGSILQFVLPLVSNLAGLVFFFGCFAALGDKKQALHDIIVKSAGTRKMTLQAETVRPYCADLNGWARPTS